MNLKVTEFDPRTIPSTMGAIGENEILQVKIKNTIYEMTIKELFEYAKTKRINKVGTKATTSIKEKPKYFLRGGVIKVTYLPSDITFFVHSSDIVLGLEKIKNDLESGLDIFSVKDTDINNYSISFEKGFNCFKLKNKYIEPCYDTFSMPARQTNLSITSVRPLFFMDKEYEQELYKLNNVKVLDKNNTWVKVLHIYKNDKMNTPIMMYVDFGTASILATEDHLFLTEDAFIRADKLKPGMKVNTIEGELAVKKVEYIFDRMDSYDIGTASGTFVASGFITHNCRTYSSADINWRDNWEKAVRELAAGRDYKVECPMSSSHMKDGRGNIAPATIILPTIAMEAKKKAKDNPEYVVDYFMDLLESAIEDCRDELIERFNWICAQSPASAKFMYENNTFYSYGDDLEVEGLRGAIKHGTLAIGQIGLAETLQILIGCDHTTEKGMRLAKEIEQLFKDKCKEYKEEWRVAHIHRSSVVEQMIKLFKEKTGREPSEEEVKEIKQYVEDNKKKIP